MMNWFKKLMLFRLLILLIQLKKTDYNRKINEIENIVTTYDNNNKYITTQDFTQLTSKYFRAKLAQENLASQTDIVDFVKKIDFNDKLQNVNKKVAYNKKRHTEKELKMISAKGLITDFINKYSSINGANCFSSNGLQNY